MWPAREGAQQVLRPIGGGKLGILRNSKKRCSRLSLPSKAGIGFRGDLGLAPPPPSLVLSEVPLL